MPNFIPGVGTSLIPAAVVYPDGQSIFVAWKGEGNDQGIYWTRTQQVAPDSASGAFTFNPSPQSWIKGIATSHSPSLASFQGRVYLAWKGEDGDNRIFWSCYDGVNWQPQTPISNAHTDIAPAIVALDSAIILVWKNASDNKICWAVSFQDNKTNQLDFNVKGPLLVGKTGLQTSHTPALARADGSNFFMAWTGVGPGYLYWAAYNVNSQWTLQAPIEPFNFSNGCGAGPTIASPALQMCPENLPAIAWVAAVTPASPDTARAYPYLNFSLLNLGGPGIWRLTNSYYAASSTPALAGEAFFFKTLNDPRGIYYDYSNPPCFSGFVV